MRTNSAVWIAFVCGWTIAAIARTSTAEDDVAADIDRLIEARLVQAEIPPSLLADDAEFLRRVTLDIIGRIPTFDEVTGFLASSDPDKRQKLVDELLDQPAYGLHFATIWQEHIVPRDTSSKKSPNDTFLPWLAQQFQTNRGWDGIVVDMLTAEGRIRETPQSGFILANSESFDPQPNLLADATARLFWGVQLRCAECHDHPFATWKETDFWSTAAFFSRTRRGYLDGKNAAGWTITESPPDEPLSQKAPSFAASEREGPAIVVPSVGGKLAGQAVRARFLGGAEPDWSDQGPYRRRFASWATSPEHPYFAANAVNRMWAHFFGRGFVNPLDEFQEKNPPSHPEVLSVLVRDLIRSEFDLKHLIRVVCSTRTYQRSSKLSGENARDETLFSHMAVRVMRPEVLYDSLAIVLNPSPAKPGNKAGGKPAAVRAQPLEGISRDEFVRFFGTVAYEHRGSTVNQGIPQFLRLMNGIEQMEDGPGLARLIKVNDSPREMIESLYLVAYSRPPSALEFGRMLDYVNRTSNERAAYSDVLWMLLNSSEFVLNH